jgi:uncharacterized SAM-binding protein YcdF (DUF218 family)
MLTSRPGSGQKSPLGWKMFLFKKIVGPFFFPLSLCLEIFLIGLFLLWFTRKKKAGKIFVSAGVILLILCTYGPVPRLLLKPLEYRYPPLLSVKDLPEIRWIVVLGAGHTSDAQMPANSQLYHSSLARLVEGIRLHHSLPGSKLILSGGALYDPVPESKVLADVALALRVERQNLILESLSRDTEEEAGLIEKMVGKDAFVLVTSASHMPRAVGLFQKLGMHPIPAPTDYGIKESPGKEISPGLFFPGSTDLQNAETAVYEYLGLAWAGLRNRI